MEQKKKRRVGRIAPCCHPPFSHFLFMLKDDKKKLVSAKHVKDKCELIRCSKTQGNEI